MVLKEKSKDRKMKKSRTMKRYSTSERIRKNNMTARKTLEKQVEILVKHKHITSFYYATMAERKISKKKFASL